MGRQSRLRRLREKKKAAATEVEKVRAKSKQRRGLNNRNKPYLNPTSWTGKMKGVPCFILGNGPSINSISDMSLLDNYFTIGINRIFYKYDPTILIWQDLALWSQEKTKVMETKSIKYCRVGAAAGIKGGFYGFKLNGREPKITNDINTLYGRGSSGSITYQFAYVLGCDPIILVGMDCQNEGKLTDFYGNNPMHRRHTLPACEKGLKFIKDNHKDRNIINCSKNKVFSSQMTIEEVIATLGEKKYNREELQKILLS